MYRNVHQPVLPGAEQTLSWHPEIRASLQNSGTTKRHTDISTYRTTNYVLRCCDNSVQWTDTAECNRPNRQTSVQVTKIRYTVVQLIS